MTNYAYDFKYAELIEISDSATLTKTFTLNLQNDSVFNSLMQKLNSVVLNKTTAKDNVNMDELLNFAVKFFSVRKISEDGNYVGKVCVGVNDIKKKEVERKPFVEAFCFASILEYYENEDYNMKAEFIIALKELYKVNLGVDMDERLLRAQGAMYMFMRNNKVLKSMLLIEYENKKEYLPFVLVEI